MDNCYLVVLDRQGKIVRTSSKWKYTDCGQAIGKRNSLQAYYDKCYPDLGYHVQIKLSATPVKMYNVYLETGIWIGEYDEDHAKKLVSIHDGWTLMEVNS